MAVRRIILAFLCVVLALGVLSADEQSRLRIRSKGSVSGGNPPPDGGAAHDYFDALAVRGDKWKCYSFRPEAGVTIGSGDGANCHYENQLLEDNTFAGYAQTTNYSTTYNYAGDTDPNKQDAARVVVTPFLPIVTTTLNGAIDATQTTITLTSTSGITNIRAIKIDNEIMKVDSVSSPNVTVTRAYSGTTGAAHSSGANVYLNTNGLTTVSMVKVPLNTADGNSYFFVYDMYYTSSYLKVNREANPTPAAQVMTSHKAYQFSSAVSTQWLEPRTRFNGGASGCQPAGYDAALHVGGLDARHYNTLGGGATWSGATPNAAGPTVTALDPFQPCGGTILMEPNKWIRTFVRIEQRANDYDYVSIWVADEDTDPVLMIDNQPLSVPSNTLTHFWVELNTSTDDYRGNTTLVSYFRNFIALSKAGAPDADWAGTLLLKPVRDGS